MFICPSCDKEFNTEQALQKHFLICWKEQHPFHQSKSAPHSADITMREINDDITNFFNSLKE
jgi:hypothetical protein